MSSGSERSAGRSGYAGTHATAEAVSGGGDRTADSLDRPANREGCVKDLPDSKTATETMTPDGLETGRGDATAVFAVRFSSELTGRNPVLEIRREALRGLREDAVVRRLGRLGVDVE